MISSMTGYGRGEITENRVTASAEIRTVNSRYLEFSIRLPRTIALRENELKELIRSKFARGKINVTVNIGHENTSEIPVKINISTAKAYRTLLETLQTEARIKGEITLDHLLKFPEVLEIDEFEAGDEKDWALVRRATSIALDETANMRSREGAELTKDLEERIHSISLMIDEIEKTAIERIPLERQRLEERLKELLANPAVLDEHRLELEMTLYVDKLDITEECVRFRSHNKFFLDAMSHEQAAGRKLNFLVQEMNREANTIGSKANHAGIAHKVVAIKEELEKIREQLQNIE
jgi:uncharacterized protein (TIGR00255 family)